MRPAALGHDLEIYSGLVGEPELAVLAVVVGERALDLSHHPVLVEARPP